LINLLVISERVLVSFEKKQLLHRGFPIPSDHVPEVVKFPVEQLPEGIGEPLKIFSTKLPYIY
jgi:hypothetical protein